MYEQTTTNGVRSFPKVIIRPLTCFGALRLLNDKMDLRSIKHVPSVELDAVKQHVLIAKPDFSAFSTQIQDACSRLGPAAEDMWAASELLGSVKKEARTAGISVAGELHFIRQNREAILATLLQIGKGKIRAGQTSPIYSSKTPERIFARIAQLQHDYERAEKDRQKAEKELNAKKAKVEKCERGAASRKGAHEHSPDTYYGLNKARRQKLHAKQAFQKATERVKSLEHELRIFKILQATAPEFKLDEYAANLECRLTPKKAEVSEAEQMLREAQAKARPVAAEVAGKVVALLQRLEINETSTSVFSEISRLLPSLQEDHEAALAEHNYEVIFPSSLPARAAVNERLRTLHDIEEKIEIKETHFLSQVGLVLDADADLQSLYAAVVYEFGIFKAQRDPSPQAVAAIRDKCTKLADAASFYLTASSELFQLAQEINNLRKSGYVAVKACRHELVLAQRAGEVRDDDWERAQLRIRETPDTYKLPFILLEKNAYSEGAPRRWRKQHPI